MTARQETLERMLDDISRLANHHIPFYAYGDNEAACDMNRRLNEIDSICQAMSAELVEGATAI